MATGSEDKTVVLWDVRQKAQIGTLSGHTESVSSLLFDQEGEDLLSGDLGGNILLWNLEEMKLTEQQVKGFGD